MIIVAAGRAFDRRPRLARIRRAICGCIHDVNSIGVPRISSNLFKVPAAIPQPLVARDSRPRRASIIRTKDAAIFRVHGGIDSISARRRD